MPIQKCIKCKQDKNLSDFRISSENSIRKQCKFCDNLHRKNWRHETGRSKKYRDKYNNRSKTREYKRLHRKLWKGFNRDKVKIYNKFRYYLRIKAGELSIKTIQNIYEDNIKQFGTLTCYLCLKPIPFGKDTFEHKTPLSRGGDNQYSNLAISCRSCNCKKYNKTLEEYKNLIIGG